jgi:hypothetical protein
VDWRDIDLTLQSGNPVTFHQAIYERTDVARPEAPIDQQQHDLPRIDQRAIEAAKSERRAAGAPPAPAPMVAARQMVAAAAPAPMEAGLDSVQKNAHDTAESDAGTAEAELPPAVGGVAESFHLATSVTLAAGQSAVLPFLEADIPFERVDLLAFNQTNPMRAMRITNTTLATWPGGAVSTQDSAGFTGDARLAALPPGESRFLSYATDLALAAHWDHAGTARRLVGYKVVQGIAKLQIKLRTTTLVDLVGAAARSPGDASAAPAEVVIVELPRESGTAVAVRGAIAADPTTSAWRARLTVAPGTSKQVRFDVDKPVEQAVQLTEATAVLAGLRGQDLDGLSPATIASLRRIGEMQAERSRLEALVAGLERNKTEAVADQQRARQNVQVLAGNDPQRARYVSQLGDIETRIQDISEQLARARRAVQEATEQLATAVSTFAVD